MMLQGTCTHRRQVEQFDAFVPVYIIERILPLAVGTLGRTKQVSS